MIVYIEAFGLEVVMVLIWWLLFHKQTMGRMLFWGQHGVAPDIQTAVKHYQRGAIRLQDPVSMYDYAIVLLTVSYPLLRNV